MRGLEYLHENDVAHRDLKPENIFVCCDGKIKIGDFGLSNSLVDGQPLLTSCGSPHYASPEIVEGHPYDGKSIDIWSAGVILYTMVTGELPFY